MQCPHCGLENTSSSIYCEECGTPLNTPLYTLDQTEYLEPQTDYSEYNAPPPPPLNGNHSTPEYDELLPPPPPVEYGSMQPQTFTHQKITSRPGPGIFSAILYFIGALIAAFGLLGTIAAFGTDSLIKSVGFILSIALLIASIFVFVRIRRRFVILRWWQRILWILGATIAGFIALIIEAIIVPNQLVTSYFVGCVFILYGLAWATIAVW